MRDACIDLSKTLGLDPEALFEEWSERAAIREYEGGQSRADAERDAFDDVRLAHRIGPKSAATPTAAAKRKADGE